MAPVCSKRPMVCPDGLREASFLIDLKNSSVSHDDLSNDLYGIWGRSSGSKAYFGLRHNRSLTQKSANEAYDWEIKKLRWTHPNSLRNGKRMFVRSLFKVYKSGEKDPVYGMLCYEWLCEPFKIVPSAHKNAKKRTDEPYYRTDRDVLREMSIERRHSTPEETYFSVKQSRGGATEVSSSSELPRGRRQIYDLAKKMDVPRSKVGHKKNNDFTEVQKLCADVNIPFARSITSGVRPETDDEKRRRLQKGERGNIGGAVVVEDAEQRNIQYFRCFLAENEQINLFNEACLRNKGRLQVDMTFDVAEGGYLTIASVRHPGILNTRTNRVNDVFS